MLVLLDTSARVLVLTESTNQKGDHEPRPCSEHLNRVPDTRRAEEQDEDDCCRHRQFVVVENISTIWDVVGRLAREHCAD
jgi:hypothetical protein